jgi:Holliday junction resolvase RusA-like endonuclease
MTEHSFFLAVTPKAAARTNCTCRGRFPTVYTAPGYRAWLDEAIPLLKAEAPDLPEDVRKRDVHIEVEVVVAKPKTTKRLRPGGDSDNYEKGVWDAMTKVGAWWVDDEQIVHNVTWKRWAHPGERDGYRVRVKFIGDHDPSAE